MCCEGPGGPEKVAKRGMHCARLKERVRQRIKRVLSSHHGKSMYINRRAGALKFKRRGTR